MVVGKASNSIFARFKYTSIAIPLQSVCVYKQRAFNASIQVVVKIVANPRKIGKMIHSPYKRHTTNQEDYDFTKKLLRI